MKHLLFSAAALLAATPALAEDVCRADVNATQIVVDRDLLGVSDTPDLRERATAWPMRTLKGLRGHVPACDSATLITYLSDTVPEGEIDAYCLAPDPEQGYLLVPGARNFRGRCARTTCEKVNAATGSAAEVAGVATDRLTRRDVEGGQSRLGAVMHTSGAAILSGSAASVTGSLSGVASGVVSALSAPAIAGAAAVSVVAVGGVVYLCRDSDTEESAETPPAE